MGSDLEEVRIKVLRQQLALDGEKGPPSNALHPCRMRAPPCFKKRDFLGLPAPERPAKMVIAAAIGDQVSRP